VIVTLNFAKSPAVIDLDAGSTWKRKVVELATEVALSDSVVWFAVDAVSFVDAERVTEAVAPIVKEAFVEANCTRPIRSISKTPEYVPEFRTA